MSVAAGVISRGRALGISDQMILNFIVAHYEDIPALTAAYPRPRLNDANALEGGIPPEPENRSNERPSVEEKEDTTMTDNEISQESALVAVGDKTNDNHSQIETSVPMRSWASENEEEEESSTPKSKRKKKKRKKNSTSPSVPSDKYDRGPGGPPPAGGSAGGAVLAN